MNVGALESINGERDLSGIINNSIKMRRSVFYHFIWDQNLHLCSVYICHLHCSTVTSSGVQINTHNATVEVKAIVKTQFDLKFTELFLFVLFKLFF